MRIWANMCRAVLRLKESLWHQTTRPIAPMSPEELAESSAEPGHGAVPDPIYDVERAYIEAFRQKVGRERDEPLRGLALSGGGIRSACIALGVMQALAKHDLLRMFDYLSSVSGGGYSGASLTWFTARQAASGQSTSFGVRDGAAGPVFPYGVDDPGARIPYPFDDARKLLRYLRQRGNYLAPGKGITLVSGIAVVLRGIVANFVVWLPVLSALMFWLIWLKPPPSAPCSTDPLSGVLISGNTPGVMCWLLGVARAMAHMFDFPAIPAAFRFFVAAAVWLLGIFAACSLVYSWLTAKARVGGGLRRDKIRDFLAHRVSGVLSLSYRYRRLFERWSRILLTVAIVLALFGSVAFVYQPLNEMNEAGTLLPLLGGIASGAWSYIQSRKPGAQMPIFVATLGALLFLYGFLLAGYAVGHELFDPHAIVRDWWRGHVPQPLNDLLARDGGRMGVAKSLAWLTLAIGLITGYFVNLNYMSLHRFYRDRLMESFMPTLARARANETGAAALADRARLSDMCDQAQPDGAKGPYHLINTNVILTDSAHRHWRERGGDSFLLSPRYCGSSATGWIGTEDWIKDSMTLSTAMAISGAAANPSVGAAGVGPTRSWGVSVVMALTNVRLGYWVPNPRLGRVGAVQPNHFWPGLSEVLGLDRTEESCILQLSDGGHFDNLGIYELIRRRAKFILLSDGAADSEFKFFDLHAVLSRIREDFGATIAFVSGYDLDALMPGTGGTAAAAMVPAPTLAKRAPAVPHTGPAYPADAKFSRRGYAIAQISYADNTTGFLVYLKATVCADMSLEIRGFKAQNPDFPNESTLDQFYSEAKFDAHRAVGFALAEQLIGDLGTLKKAIPGLGAVL